MALGGVRPQCAGARGPLDHPTMQRQEHQEALRGPRNAKHVPPPEQGESAQQCNHEVTIGPRQGVERGHESPRSWRRSMTFSNRDKVRKYVDLVNTS